MSRFVISSIRTSVYRRRILLPVAEGFLYSNGSQTPFLTGRPISTSNKSFTVSYLVNSCGLPEDEALSASKKVQLKTSAKPDSVLALFRKHDFSDTQISKIIKKFPVILLTKPDKTLTPKLEYFNSIGFSGPDLAKLVCKDPQILKHRSLEKTIKPIIAFLKGLGLTQSNVIKLITRSTRVLKQLPQKRLAPAILFLQTHGVPNHLISKLLVANARPILCTSRLAEVVKEIIKLKLEPSKASFVDAIIVMSCLSKSSWEAKYNVYKRCGWSEDAFLMAFRKHPFCMKLSEKKIMGTMEYLVNKMGYDPLICAKTPELLGLSLEDRIVPRLSVIRKLVSNGLVNKDFNISTILKLTNEEFVEKYVRRFESQVPKLLNVYQGKS